MIQTKNATHQPVLLLKNHYNVNKTGAYSAELSGAYSPNQLSTVAHPYPVATEGHGKSPTLSTCN